MALLASRKEARGGKSLAQKWADDRKDNQAKAKAMRRKVEPSVTGVRKGPTKWELLRTSDGLASMTEAKLELEHIRVMQEVTNAVKEGRSDSRSSYYMQRLADINTLFEKAKRTQMVVQRKRAAEAKETAGTTEKSKIRSFTRGYKRAVRLDAPVSEVNFYKFQLIDLWGPDEFYKWSGEPRFGAKEAKPVEDVIAQVPKKKTIAKKIEDGQEITVLEPATKDDVTIAEYTKGQAKKESRKTFDRTMAHLQSEYTATGKPLDNKYNVPRIHQ